MKNTFIIIDDETDSILKTLSIVARFKSLHFVASASSYEEGLDLILEHQPSIVFLEINPNKKESGLSLQLINELYRYLTVIPKIIVTSSERDLAYQAIKHGAFDYLSKPINSSDVRKLIFRFEKNLSASSFAQESRENSSQAIEEQTVSLDSAQIIADPVEIYHGAETEKSSDDSELRNGQDDDPVEASEIIDRQEPIVPILVTESQSVADKAEKPLIICVKSYGDYRFIEAKDICYLQADNNSTDIHLFNGEMITAFKTLKHFENVLTFPFVRIHNSYIVNIDYVSRIHTGNSVCYIKNTTIKLPFSKSYKENVDAIITSITKGNYLEI